MDYIIINTYYINFVNFEHKKSYGLQFWKSSEIFENVFQYLCSPMLHLFDQKSIQQ